jgi:hypothetical protein
MVPSGNPDPVKNAQTLVAGVLEGWGPRGIAQWLYKARGGIVP